MGINIGKLLIKTNIEDINCLSGKRIAIDTSNMLYQFLTSIRLKNGDFIKNKNGDIASHLYGLFFRSCSFIELGIYPIFVFDGTPPILKSKTLELRKRKKDEAKILKDQAFKDKKESDYIKYFKRCSYITNDIIDSSKKLFQLMGIPVVQSPSEGEAQASYMSIQRDVDYVVSQDYDTLLFGANKTIRNLIISKNYKIDNTPEILSLSENLNNLGITRDQLIDLCLCIGTDFNDGIPRVGYKTALKLIKKYSTIESILYHKFRNSNINIDLDSFLEAKNFFLNPPVLKEYYCKLKKPKIDKLISFLYEKYDFDFEKTVKYCCNYQKNYEKME